MKKLNKKAKPATNSSKFDWKARQTGGPREKTQAMGFDGNLSKKGLKKTQKFVAESKEFKAEVRKPR